ncbi:DNA polymerase V family [Actinidia rufa]|uniref:DNA polymerase V family n=1 Tax=Actinidia rufa TaxID=165716 RepID=A0A7J0DH17_9ERIC|nr:DNA polymerase V family [Actinidia rufa]
MGSKKRGSSAAEEVENQLDTGTDKGFLESSKKKMKKEKKKEVADGSASPSSTGAAKEVENQLDTGTDKGVSELSKKKMKKEKKKEVADGSASPSSTGATKEVENQLDSGTDKAVSESSKKKMKKEKKKEAAEGFAVPSSTTQSITPMERRKKRKSLDKERHHADSDDAGAKHEPLGLKADETRASMATSPSSDLPEFHIRVFKDLASADATVREAAVESLVVELQEVQTAYDKLEKKEMAEGGLQLEAEKDDGLNNCAPSLRYAIRRLIRGVSSSRECARQGFALGLTVLVGAIPCIKIDALLKLTVDLLEVSSSMKGQEVRDCLLGRLFAYGAIARSGRLTEEWVYDQKSPSIKEFTGSLISLAAKKRYLQEPTVSVILDLVEKLPVEILLNQVLETPGLQEWFKGANEVGNVDALHLALKMREKISVNSKVFGKLLPDPYSPSGLLSADHLSSLANCLKESTFCQPRVHSVWPVLVNILLPDMVLPDIDSTSGLNSIKKHKKNRKCSSSEEEIQKNLQCFCEVIIEGCLLLSSHDRKHLAFDVVLLLLPRLPASCIPIVLSYKLVQCLVDILSTKDSWLYKVAQYFLNQLSNWVKHDDVRRVAVIVALQKHSNGRFDCITRTKTVKDLMGEFKTESGSILFIQNLINMFLDEGHASEEPSDQSQTTDDNSEIGSVEDKDSVGTMGTSDFLKSWVIDSLPSVLKHLQLDPEAKFREITSFELQEKFRWPKAAISSALCRMCIEQVQLLLANAQKGDHLVTSGLETSDLGSYFMRFLSTLSNIPSVSLFRALSDEDEKAFKKMQAMETRLSREERNCGLSADANKLHALRYLLIQLVLQVLLRPGEFSEAASELIICCKKAFATPDLLDSSGEDDADGDETPALMDVLVDTLLSLLPQSSAPMRSAIEQVFKYFCNDVTDDGLLRMLRVIKKDLKPARHQDRDSEDNDDDDDEDLLGIEEAEESDEAETGETGESDGQTDDSEAVVGVEAVNKELPEGSDDSDGGMDDDAMFRMDTYLSRILSERKNQAGGKPPQVLKVYSNLAQAFVSPHTAEGSEQLGQRIWGILQKKIFKAKDYPRGEAVQLSMLEPLLEKNLKLASKPFKKKKSVVNPSKKKQSASWSRHKMITSLAQQSTFWILKIIEARKFPESELQRVLDIFQDALETYFDSKKFQMKSEFLKEIVRRRPWIGHHIFEFLLDKCCSSKSEFRRVEALDLVIEILKSLVSVTANDSGWAASKKTLKSHLPKMCHVIKELVTNMPEKQSRRAEVRKFCSRVFQIITSLNLSEPFLQALEPNAHAACETQLGDAFLTLKKVER